MRFLVERKNDTFDDVGAETLTLSNSGALWFLDADGQLIMAYNSDQWVTVVPEKE